MLLDHFTWTNLSQAAKIHSKRILSHVLEFQKDGGVAASKKQRDLSTFTEQMITRRRSLDYQPLQLMQEIIVSLQGFFSLFYYLKKYPDSMMKEVFNFPWKQILTSGFT